MIDTITLRVYNILPKKKSCTQLKKLEIPARIKQEILEYPIKFKRSLFDKKI